MAGTLLRMPFQMFCDKWNHSQSVSLAWISQKTTAHYWREAEAPVWKPATKQNPRHGTCLDFLGHLIFVIGQLHRGAFPRGKVFRGRDHLPIFELQVLHQELGPKHRNGSSTHTLDLKQPLDVSEPSVCIQNSRLSHRFRTAQGRSGWPGRTGTPPQSPGADRQVQTRPAWTSRTGSQTEEEQAEDFHLIFYFFEKIGCRFMKLEQ